MLLGYNTNGLAHHDLCQAIELLAEIGYRSVAITVDHAALNPFDEPERLARQTRQVQALLARHGMRSVIETGARYLLDPHIKHEPTLLSSDADAAARRSDFLRRSIDLAAALGSDCVSLWSGALRGEGSLPPQVAYQRLLERLLPVVAYAESKGVVLGFEPEPGMFIDTLDKFFELEEGVASPYFKLTLDVGHLHCQGETPLPDQIARCAGWIENVHIEDMRAGIHEHLMFGEGEMDFPPILDALAAVGYQGGVHVELSRHSHEGPLAARRAYEFLSPLVARSLS